MCQLFLSFLKNRPVFCLSCTLSVLDATTLIDVVILYFYYRFGLRVQLSIDVVIWPEHLLDPKEGWLISF